MAICKASAPGRASDGCGKARDHVHAVRAECAGGRGIGAGANTQEGSGELVMAAELSFSARLWKSVAVKRSVYLCRLLAIFLIVGLVVAPISVPACAAASGSMSMGSMSMGSMSDEMPCCPDKSAPVDCDKCPLMAICMFKTFQALPSSGLVEVLPTAMRSLLPRSDPAVESLGHPPPPRPPQSLVRSA